MLAAGLALAVCYFLSASRLSVHELVAGAVAWSAAMGFVLRVRSGARHRFKWTRWAWVGGRTLASVPADTLAVAGVLCCIWRRRPPSRVGTIRRQAFRHGGGEPADAGRRALVTLARSFAPNEFVIDVPDNGDWLRVHSLSSSSPPSKDRKWPV